MSNNPVCPLCGSQGSEERFSQRGYQLRVCNQCELLFIDPYPGANEDVHERVSDYSHHEMDIADPEVHRKASVHFYKKYFPMVAKECQGAKSVLDIGCGGGYLLQQLGSYLQLDRSGIELNAGRAEMARNIAGCDIHEVPVEKFSSPKKFDVIIAMNVLSHMYSFDRLFQSLRSLLNAKGKFILKVGEYGKNVRRTDVFDWEIPDHLHFLGHNTINFVCQKYDFKIDSHYRVPHSEDYFSPDRWKAPGRSRFRNMIKSAVVHTPFALRALAKCYDLTHGKRVYSSFIVLSSKT